MVFVGAAVFIGSLGNSSSLLAALSLESVIERISGSPLSLFRDDARIDSRSLKLLAPDHKAVKRSRFVRLKTERLEETKPDGKKKIKGRISLNLFPAVSIAANIQKSEEIAPNTLFAKGKIVNVPLSDISILSKNGRLTGYVRTASTIYEIRHVEGGVHVIREIDPKKFKEVHPPQRRDARPLREVLRPSRIISTEPITIDLLTVYTRAARDAVGGEQNIKDLIDLAVAETNNSFENSNVYQRINLVESREVEYTESDNSETDLNRLTERNDGYMDTVHSLRDQYGADLVALFADGFESTQTRAGTLTVCGRGYLMDSTNYTNFEAFAFVVVDLGCGGIFTLAHELGHQMGAHHDQATAGEYQGLYYYSFGYQDPQQRFRTVMAYDCPANCPRVPFFSNPRVNFNTLPTGITDQVDNAKTLNNTREIVAGLRTRQISAGSVQAISRILSQATTTPGLRKGKEISSTPTEATQVIEDRLKTILPLAVSGDNFRYVQTFIPQHPLIKGVSLVLRKNGDPTFLLQVKLAVPNTVNEFITFTTINKDRIPITISSTNPQWVRVDFREPIQVSTRQKYQLFIEGRTSNAANNYSTAAGFDSYRFGELTRNPSDGRDEVRLNSDLMLQVHYQVPAKQLR